jgi:hypothetical protein
MVAAELPLALHLSANAIESTNTAATMQLASEPLLRPAPLSYRRRKDRHRLAAAYFNRAGRLANDLDSFGGGATAAPTKRATLQSPLKQLSVDKVEAKKERINDCYALFGCTKCRMEKRRSFER